MYKITAARALHVHIHAYVRWGAVVARAPAVVGTIARTARECKHVR